ncbi:MAG: ElyC/SanA/YdcF family protein, partial [Bacillota bacterium]|nr:ElyC/SanA/YdcF family protein [Bacillota bacterium]
KEGLPEKAIFMDYAGYSTYESMYRAKNTFGVKKAFIVTQEFHLGRALYIARALGIDAYGVAADRRPYRNIWYNYAREYLARVKDFFTAIVKPKPAKSGKIPVAGGGNTLEG